MLKSSRTCLATGWDTKKKVLWGSPGAPIIKMRAPTNIPERFKSYDIVVTYTHNRKRTDRLLHYLGKHVPQPQKSLWSPDTPVPQDRHLFKLTTLDIDAFKYWFGVKRSRVDKDSWKLLWRAGLLPPSYFQMNPLMPRPVFEKEELYKYYLANRKPIADEAREKELNYKNSLVRSPAEKAADRPEAPWL